MANKTPKQKHLTQNTCCCASYSFKDRCWGLGCKSSFKQRVLVQTIGLIPGSAKLHLSPCVCIHRGRQSAALLPGVLQPSDITHASICAWHRASAQRLSSVIISKYQILKFAYRESGLVPGHSYNDCLLYSVF